MQNGNGGYDYGYQYPYAYYGQAPGAYAQYSAGAYYGAYPAASAASGAVTSASVSQDPSVDPLAYPGTQPAAVESKADETAKKTARYAAGRVWEDTSMADWPDNDFRIYVGNLGEEVDDKMLREAFDSFPTLARARVVRDKKYDLTKGFGFVSFLDPREGVKAMKAMNGRYIGQRPCKLSKSTHDKRAYTGPGHHKNKR